MSCSRPVSTIGTPYPESFEDWFVVQCKPRQEQRARDNIVNQGADALLFLRPVERIRAGKRLAGAELWFPGYLFVQMSQESLLWSTIRSTYGVLRLVRFGERPTPIQPQVLQQLCDAVTQVNEKPKYKKGDSVMLRSGPFEGLEAIFTAYDGQMRAVLLINFLQRQQTVKVPLAQIG